jgi:hypothetical protein
MKREMKPLEAKIKALREAMELFDIFQQDDEVGSALAEVEAELVKFKFK